MSTELAGPSGQASDQPNNGAAGMEVDAQAAQQQTGPTTDQPSIRVLALYCTGSSDDTDPGFDPLETSNASLLAARSGVEVEVMRGPSLDEFAARVESYRPTFVYMSGPYSGLVDSIKGAIGPLTLQGKQVAPGELLTALEGAPLETVYLDAAGQEKVAELLRSRGVPNVMFWSEDPSGLVAAHFSSIFFSMMALESSVTILEAYALALFSTQAHLGAKVDGKLTMPNMPDLLTGPRDDPEGVTLALPDNASVPLPQLPGLDLSRGVAAAVEGWMDVRLLAPRAELRVQVGGGSSMVDAGRLSYLGEALRALLVLEVRCARLLSASPPSRLPSHLQEGCSALLCEVATSSGASVRVVLGGRPGLLASQQLVEHALRQTLVRGAAAAPGLAAGGAVASVYLVLFLCFARGVAVGACEVVGVLGL
eukprot:GHRQ01007249.1.p1 GENE.GHRQ01007249.1~~GHRQ01007249.1.p1  ORF type:complete len:423 (+),score=169.00 GHRQ01007249.1:147-1415(+)